MNKMPLWFEKMFSKLILSKDWKFGISLECDSKRNWPYFVGIECEKRVTLLQNLYEESISDDFLPLVDL
jgi:hypothetical protein